MEKQKEDIFNKEICSLLEELININIITDEEINKCLD